MSFIRRAHRSCSTIRSLIGAGSHRQATGMVCFMPRVGAEFFHRVCITVDYRIEKKANRHCSLTVGFVLGGGKGQLKEVRSDSNNQSYFLYINLLMGTSCPLGSRNYTECLVSERLSLRLKCPAMFITVCLFKSLCCKSNTFCNKIVNRK